MQKEIIEVPVLSELMRKLGVPCNSVTRARIVHGDIEMQTDASLNAVRLCLEAAGTSFDKVVMVRVYASNSGFYNAINRVYRRHFPDNFPSRTFVPVSGWPMEFDIEIEMMALA